MLTKKDSDNTSFLLAAGAQSGFLQQQPCWTSAQPGLSIEERNIKPSFQGCGVRGQHLFQRKGRLSQQRQKQGEGSYLFPPAKLGSVFLDRKLQDDSFEGCNFTNWSAWDKSSANASTTSLLSRSPSYLWQKQPVGNVWVHILKLSQKSVKLAYILFHYASGYFLWNCLINVIFPL